MAPFTNEQRAYMHGLIGSETYRLFRSRNKAHQTAVRRAWAIGNAERLCEVA